MLNYKLTVYSKLCIFIYILITLNNFSLIESIPCTPELKTTDECTISVTFKEEDLKEKNLLIHFDNFKLLKGDTLKLEKDPKLNDLNKFENGFVVIENPFEKIKPKEILFLFKPATAGLKYDFENKIHILNLKNSYDFNILDKLNFFFTSKQDLDLKFNSLTDNLILFNTLNEGIKIDDVDLTAEDYLLEKNTFIITFKSLKDNFVHINTLFGNKECSKKYETDKTVSINTPEKNDFLIEFTCINVIKSKDVNSKLQIDKIDNKDKNDQILLQIKDGSKVSSEDLIYTNLNNYGQYKDNLKNTLSSQSKILIILKSSQITSNYSPSSVAIKISNVQKFNSEKFSCSTDKDEKICFFVADENKFAYLKLDKTLPIKDAEVSFYNDLEMNEPFLVILKDQVLNDLVYSSTKYLVMKIKVSKPFKIDGEFLSTDINCNRVSTDSSTYVLKYNEKILKQECSFYIAPKADQESFLILNLENYLINADSCLTLKVVSEEKNYFEICPKKLSSEIISKKPLQFVFKNTDHVILKYKSGSESKNRVLVQASLVYDTMPLGSKKLSQDKILTMKTNNYLLNSPYFLQEYNYEVNSEKDYIYGSFENYDFRGKDIVTSSKILSFTKNFPDNFIVNKAYSLKVKSTFDMKELDEYHKGFLANFEEITCTKEDTKDTFDTTSYPADYSNLNKCVWVVNNFDAKTGKYLEVVIEKSKTATELGKITIYDDATTNRDKLKVNINEDELKKTNFLKLNTTSTKLVIYYETQNKAVSGLKFKINEKVCSKTCDDGTRCILPSIRCNFISECLDGEDEKDCSQIIPPTPIPPPAPQVKTGISGWLVTFFIIPLSMIVGALLFKHGPKALAKFKGHTYQEFNTFGEDA